MRFRLYNSRVKFVRHSFERMRSYAPEGAVVSLFAAAANVLLTGLKYQHACVYVTFGVR